MQRRRQQADRISDLQRRPHFGQQQSNQGGGAADFGIDRINGEDSETDDRELNFDDSRNRRGAANFGSQQPVNFQDEADALLLNNQKDVLGNTVNKHQVSDRGYQGSNTAIKPVGGLGKGGATSKNKAATRLKADQESMMKGKNLIGYVNKLSNWGFSNNERVLKLNKKGLSYFSKPPEKNGEGAKPALSVEMIERQSESYKPKMCVPLDAIISVEEISAEEREKNKKYFKNGDSEVQAFKVTFHEQKIKEKTDLLPESGEQSLAQIMLDDHSGGSEEERKDAAANRIKDLKVWYFSLDKSIPDETVVLPPLKKEWMLNISIYCKRTNPKFKFSPYVKTQLDRQRNNLLANSTEAPGVIKTQESVQDEQQHIYGGRKDPLGVDRAMEEANKAVDIDSDDDRDQILKRFNKDNDIADKDKAQGDADGDDKDINDNKNNLSPLEAYRTKKIKEIKGTVQQAKPQLKQSTLSQHERDTIIKAVYNLAMQGIEKRDEKQNTENLGWDLKFQKLVDYVTSSSNDMSRNFNLSQRLLHHVKTFREEARDQVKLIVDGLHRNQYKPISNEEMKDKLGENFKLAAAKFCDEDQESERSKLIFYEKNMIIKLTHPTDFIEYSLDEEEQTTQAQAQFDDGQSVLYKETEKGRRQLWKQYAREILSQDVIFDANLFNLSSQQTDKSDDENQSSKSRIRVPLSAMIDYKGFRAIAIAYVEINAHYKPELGFYEGQYTYSKRMDRVYQDLRNIGIVLNLKENRQQTTANQQQYKRVPVSSFVCIYKNTSGANEEKQDEDEDDVLKNFFVHHFKDLEYDKDPQYYIVRTSEMFPYDIDPLDSNMDNYHRDRVLRPELICANEKSLRADTKKQPKDAQKRNKKGGAQNMPRPSQILVKEDNEDNTDIVDLNLANKFLREMKIPQLVQLLDYLIIIPTDSETLEEAFHIQGVNMRYLGKVAQKSTLKHVKDLCVTEMLARTLKRIFNKAISEQILKHQERKQANEEQRKQISKEINSIEKPESYGLKLDQQKVQHPKSTRGESTSMQNYQEKKRLEALKQRSEEIKQEAIELKKSMDVLITEWIIDFLNLVFGHSDDTRNFWSQVLFPEVSVYYSYEMRELVKFEKNLNALYFALVQQINLKVTEKQTMSESPSNNDAKNKLASSQNYGNKAGYSNMNHQDAYNPRNKAQKEKQTAEMKEESAFYKEFGKSPDPFSAANLEFELVAKTRTYHFRNLMYNMIAQKFRDYKNNGHMKEAFETCKMRKHMLMCLRDADCDLSTKLDLCQIQLEERQWMSAQKMAQDSIQELKMRQMGMHAKAIQFQSILMQAHYMAGEFQAAEKAFTLALEILDHHWGPYHPLHINIYGIMAQLLILNHKYEDATYLYKASLRCCMRILGPNHIQTGEVHMDYARLQLLKAHRDEHSSKALQQKSDSLQHFMESFNIFKNYFHSNRLDSLQTAEAAIQIAELLEEDNRLEEALEKATVASQTYQNVYAQDNPLIIKAMWQELSIAYAVKSHTTEQLAAELFYALVKRDHILSIGDIQTYERHVKQTDITNSLLNGGGPDHQGNSRLNGPSTSQKTLQSASMIDENSYTGGNLAGRTGTDQDSQSNAALAHAIALDRNNKEIDKIKAYLIATIIMEKTRNLKPEEKNNLKAFCDKELFYEIYEQEGDFKEKKENIIKNLEAYHYTNLNPLRVASVRNLDFQDSANQLLHMYNHAAKKIDWLAPEDRTELEKRKYIFHQRYLKMIKQVNEKEAEAHKNSQTNAINIYDESNLNLLDRNGTDGYPDMILPKVNDDEFTTEFNAFSSFVDGQPSVGPHNDPNDTESCRNFFRRLIKIFDNVNFYNLLIRSHDEASNEHEKAGVDE